MQGETTMNRLAMQAINAHGGLERWNHFITLSAHLIQGGELWAAKGKAGILADVTVAVDLRAEGFSLALRFSRSKVALRTATSRD
jgi:hypothetical protein